MSTSIKSKRLTNWILKHDDCKIFIILYIGLAVVLSLLISLFWLVFVVLIHFILEFLRQRFLNSDYAQTILIALWEVKLDIALVLFALWLGVYMDFVFGIAGIGIGARSAAQVGSRFAIWQRVIRGVLLSLDDVAQFLRFSGKVKKSPQEDEEEIEEKVSDYEDTELVSNPWKSKWSFGDWFSISFGIIMLLLIVLAPYITSDSYNDVFIIMCEELHPWPY